MEVDITILVENATAMPYFQGEYGFSTLVKAGEKAILFDTGSGRALLKNAAAAGVDLAEIQDLVISHVHYVHTGALIPFIKTGNHKRIYAHSNVFARRYTGSGWLRREIGADFTAGELASLGAEIVFTDDFCEISPGIFVTGTIPRYTDFEDVGGDFWTYFEGDLVPDDLADDMALIINHPLGLIIISGCAHAGIINTIEYARLKTGQPKILAFIGGTHLISASDSRLAKTVAALRDLDVQHLIVCHCTGFRAAAILFNELGSRVVRGKTGMQFHF
ncbi:MAG: MBL fold metallo-hydrolase [Syntrophomonadaceae bacterium]|nr:MBL fold metallo-hydrolase [Syntrophomonadaceae bacterium]